MIGSYMTLYLRSKGSEWALATKIASISGSAETVTAHRWKSDAHYHAAVNQYPGLL